MPRKTKRRRTIAIRSMRYDGRQPILPKIEAILFQERSETFTKKTDILANLVSIFNMNCSEFASVLYCTE